MMAFHNRITRHASRRLALALPLAFVLFAAACADNPADGIAPAEVSDVSPTVEDAAEAAEDAIETGDIIPEGPVSEALLEEEEMEGLGYVDEPVAGDAEAMPSDEPGAGGVEAAGPARVFVINPGNSKIEFECSKVTRSHIGGFNAFSGEIQVPGETPEGAALSVTIQTDSIWTDTDQLTGHLKTADFFDVATYPESTFVLTAAAPTETGYDLTGDFTLHGVTKSITFPAAISINEDSVTATSEFVINRFDFGIEYPGMADDLIRSEVVIRLNISADAA